jgi:hypothetical protein
MLPASASAENSTAAAAVASKSFFMGSVLRTAGNGNRRSSQAGFVPSRNGNGFQSLARSRRADSGKSVNFSDAIPLPKPVC